MRDLSLDERERGDETGVEGGRDGEESPGAIAVVVSEMVSDVSVNVVDLHQLRSERCGVSVGTDQRNVARAADAAGGEAGSAGAADVGKSHGLGLEVEELDGLVDGVLGHFTVGSPLATGAGEQTGGGCGDEMASDEGLSVLGVGVLDKRSDACELLEMFRSIGW